MKQQLLLVALCTSACVDQPTVDPIASQVADPTEYCRSTTVTGSIFYNDLRRNGRFSIRDTPPTRNLLTGQITAPGQPGTRERFGTGDDFNFLALRDATVELFEIDEDGSGSDCEDQDLVGTTTVDRDGTFTWTGSVCDRCVNDADGSATGDLSLAVKVSLQNCDDPSTRCFSVRDPDGVGVNDHYTTAWEGEVWSRWFAGARPNSPREYPGPYISYGTAAIDLGSDYFQATGNAKSKAARAANVFASMVDVTRKVHLQLNVPYEHDEVRAYFPSVTGGTAHSHEDGRLCESDPGPEDSEAWDVTVHGWPDGGVTTHEYGHLLHYVKWDNEGKWVSYCFDHDGDGHIDEAMDTDGDDVPDWDLDAPWLESEPDNLDECAESSEQKEFANTAFKEGWANFISGVTFDGHNTPDGCDSIETDGLRGCHPTDVCPTARQFFGDVTRILCDVWDNDRDCTLREGVEVCDDTQLSLVQITNDLEDVWDHATQAQRDIVTNADSGNRAILSTFGLCTLFDELDDANIEETFKVSGLSCGP